MPQAQLLPAASPFQFNNFPIRTQLEGDQLWFAAKDVCAALDITWTGHSLSSIPDDWQRVVKLTTLRRGAQGLRVISEPAVYKLAFRSNKPEADAFTNWIASEVVPAIRKTGKYEKPAKQPKALPEAKPKRTSPPDYRTHGEVKARLRGVQRDLIENANTLLACLDNIDKKVLDAFHNPARRGEIATHTDNVLDHFRRSLLRSKEALENQLNACNDTLSGVIGMARVLENPQASGKAVMYGVQTF